MRKDRAACMSFPQGFGTIVNSLAQINSLPAAAIRPSDWSCRLTIGRAVTQVVE